MNRSKGTDSSTMTSRAFAIEAARLMVDRHCEDVLVIDVRGISQVCDYLVIGTGTSDRQMRSVANELEDQGKEVGHEPFRKHTDTNDTWIVTDFVDVVVHLFEPNLRGYYDLESLWADGPRLDWKREAGLAADYGVRETGS